MGKGRAMGHLNTSRVFGMFGNRALNRSHINGERVTAAKLRRAIRPVIEALEARTMLSTTPVPFQLNSRYSIGASPSDVVVADVNGDGKMDAITVLSGSNAVSVSLGNGHGSFGTPTTFAVGSNPVWLATADFNGDGKPDIVTA